MASVMQILRMVFSLQGIVAVAVLREARINFFFYLVLVADICITFAFVNCNTVIVFLSVTWQGIGLLATCVRVPLDTCYVSSRSILYI